MVKREGETPDDFFERSLKEKQKLFGNIQFVGDLFEKRLMSDYVICLVFTDLLGVDNLDDSNINDNTIEAALKLINKIGKTLDDDLAKHKEKYGETGDKQNKKIFEVLTKTYARFTELMNLKDSDPKNRASTRIKFLIKNMFDDRSKGWPKAQLEEKTILTKNEVAKAVADKEAQQKQQDSGKRANENPREREREGGNKRGDKRGGKDEFRSN